MRPSTTRIGLGVAAIALAAAGTVATALHDPLPPRVVLADHRAGADSLFAYPWC